MNKEKRPRKRSFPYKKITTIVMLLVFGGYFICRQLAGSLFFRSPDRLNLVVYGQYPVYYSLGLRDNVNYYFRFNPDMKVIVPGGYGSYRTGAVGKLVFLEKKPGLLRKTFSLATRSFVRQYFHNGNDKIYYAEGEPDIIFPGPRIFLTADSNAGWADRLFYVAYFWGKTPQNFVTLTGQSEEVKGENIFLNDQFGQKYGGYFYDNRYRAEKLNVQVIYGNSYATALALSRMMEGSGIRVGDISRRPTSKGSCRVLESGISQSVTAAGLVNFFGCRYNKANTGIADIILELNDTEGEWAV